MESPSPYAIEITLWDNLRDTWEVTYLRPGKGKPFLPGNPDGRAGRPPGALNQTMKAARDFAQRLLNDPEYQAFVRERLLSGKLDVALEKMLWAYAWGPPPDRPITALNYLINDEY